MLISTYFSQNYAGIIRQGLMMDGFFIYLCLAAAAVIQVDVATTEVGETAGSVDICLTIDGVADLECPVTVNYQIAPGAAPVGTYIHVHCQQNGSMLMTFVYDSFHRYRRLHGSWFKCGVYYSYTKCLHFNYY